VETEQKRATADEKKRDALALALAAPASTIALATSTLFGGLLGTAVWIGGKVWEIGLPAFWRLKVEEREISWSPAREGGLREGALLGVGISVVMFVAWWLARGELDSQLIRGFVEPFGLLNPWLYLAVFCYWVFFNSVMEEYLFRWFIFEKLETFVSGRVAVVLAALIFTIHHIFGMAAMFPLWATLLGAFGVFCGGVIWSWLYLRYRSIWPSYISHAIVDVTMFGIGAIILFG
jgi:membrane protease YdiL (CAAX protease family)